jgi:hypothetical protein
MDEPGIREAPPEGISYGAVKLKMKNEELKKRANL